MSGKTLIDAEDNQTITGVKTFDLDPAAPFAVTANSSVVANLDADKVDGKHSTDLLLLSGAQAMTGALDLGTVGQIQFPAAQNASAGANVLDDYEEGVWTPVLTFATAGNVNVVYSSQSGTYTKIGRQVVVHFSITTTTFTHTTAAGGLQLTGLPFTVGALIGHGNYWFTGVTKAGYTSFVVRAVNATTVLDFVASGSGVTASQVNTADAPSGTQQTVVGTVTYFV